ncbi:hypothetical protein D5H75_38060 [Bailinhaonella thermotolerans]|uniref:Uncharacterized protein n=2 Tax=Bailinhaonella thermotolerans TaxID=1070861 RepID=A0A3A4A1L2_9ACTN|nr:hypothetical protein D5H75_38060 [Bailinhaonella thermotolerans]
MGMQMLIALLVLLAGLASGYLVGFAHGRAQVRPPVPRAVCGCGHTLGFHQGGTGPCHGRVDRQAPSWGHGHGHGHEPVRERCTCRLYDGPELLGRVIAPELVEREDGDDQGA